MEQGWFVPLTWSELGGLFSCSTPCAVISKTIVSGDSRQEVAFWGLARTVGAAKLIIIIIIIIIITIITVISIVIALSA